MLVCFEISSASPLHALRLCMCVYFRHFFHTKLVRDARERSFSHTHVKVGKPQSITQVKPLGHIYRLKKNKEKSPSDRQCGNAERKALARLNPM